MQPLSIKIWQLACCSLHLILVSNLSDFIIYFYLPYIDKKDSFKLSLKLNLPYNVIHVIVQ